MRFAVGVCLDVAFLLFLGCWSGVLGKTVYIQSAESDDVQFLRALEDQTVDRIVFTGDYSAGHQFDVYDGQWKEGMPIIRIHRRVQPYAANDVSPLGPSLLSEHCCSSALQLYTVKQLIITK